MNIAFIRPYQVPSLVSTKTLEFLCPHNSLPLLECSEKWHLPRNTSVVSCICSRVTNDALTDIEVGILRNLLKRFPMVLDTVPDHQLLRTICKLWWTPRTWTVFGCACIFVLGPDAGCGGWFDSIFGSRLTKLSCSFHGTNKPILCWCIMLDPSSLIDGHS
jgi:hypothetical protein